MKISILIPDGEQALLMRVAYCFSVHKHIKIFAMSNTKHFPMRYSRHLHKIIYVEKTNENDWVKNINKIVEEYNIDLIMPLYEEGIKTLITHKDLVVEKDKLVSLSKIEDYIKALDKSELAKHLLKNNIAHPKTIIFKPNLIEYSGFSSLSFPVIVKPAVGYGGEGIHVFKIESDLMDFLIKMKKPGTYVVQEFIEGYDIDCSVLCENGDIVASTIQKGTLFENQQFAPAIGLQFSKNEQLLDIVKTLIKSLNWSGVAHIDLRYDSKLKDYKIIEINGRFWSSIDASLAAGINFPYLYCLKSKQKALTFDNNYKDIAYLNLKGLFKTIKKNPLFLLKFSFIMKNSTLLFSIKDPLPVIVMFYKKLKSKYNRKNNSISLMSYPFIELLKTGAGTIK